MKKTILQEIQDVVIQYGKVISHVIKMDVEIVDANLFRISGTGIYNNQINIDMSKEGFVYKQVLATGKTQLIEKPGEHIFCTLCPKQGRCEEKMELCTPIKLNDEIIGVIGLICFNEEQKQKLLDDIDFYQLFIMQIAEFISAKAYEQRERERDQVITTLLMHVINNVDKGVLILNQNNQIIQINNSAVKQLQLTSTCINEKVAIEPTGDSMLGAEEYKVTIAQKKFKLMGDLLTVSPGFAVYDKIFIFNEMKSVKSDIYGLTNVAKSVSLENIIGESEAIKQLKNKIRKVADSNSTVLVSGQSGTGKELVARAIHAESNRSTKPFIAVNCGAIPDTLLESELFGYIKGAFTGADPRGKIGKFELANKGVIFLDEVGDMPIYLQVKLLRVLQERKLVRIGSNQLISFDVRVIAATNKDLKALIKENKFREDLFYRLNVIPLEVPSLSQRIEDIHMLVTNTMAKYCGLFHKKVRKIDQATMDILIRYPWPGNVRELENTIEFMINMADDLGVLTKETLPRNIREYKSTREKGNEGAIRLLREVEQEHIMKAIAFYGDNTKGKQVAARQLGIGIATLYRKLNERL
ncbi:sigma-54-dependent Fis family transcriptional regulator [Pelosinus sp. IPA-1]|uniref:sigma-54 interaction domain-containing protein n=1 Tax=Pelosinus sp. IPA-1 TaxID=3029569 RepID=UPI0024361A22|nr:sigma-54-dependent Fis family transcriptional regulator [Pelosinus sp. IPA-1]GMB00555.1 ATPase AAA [Pelosinus sp. IPA-1]